MIDDQVVKENYVNFNEQGGRDDCPDAAISSPKQQENAGEPWTGLEASFRGGFSEQLNTLLVKSGLQTDFGDWTGPLTDSSLGQTTNSGHLSVAQPSNPGDNLLDQQKKTENTLQTNVEGATNTRTEPLKIDLENIFPDLPKFIPHAAADLSNIPPTNTAGDVSSSDQESHPGVTSAFLDPQNPQPFEIMSFQKETAYDADTTLLD